MSAAGINSAGRDSKESFLEALGPEALISGISFLFGYYMNKLKIIGVQFDNKHRSKSETGFSGRAIYDSKIHGIAASRYEKSDPFKQVKTIARTDVSVHVCRSNEVPDPYLSVSTTHDKSEITLLTLDAEGRDFLSLVTNIRAAEYFQQTAVLNSIDAGGFHKIIDIASFCKDCEPLHGIDTRFPNADQVEIFRKTSSEANEFLQPTLDLIKILAVAKEIPPMPLPNDIISASSNEKEAIGLSHILHIFYILAHWFMQNANKDIQSIEQVNEKIQDSFSSIV